MRAAANKHRRHVEYQIGDRVLLKLQLYRQHSVARPLSAKLARRYYGPYEVLERIGQVTYRLQLPTGSGIHNVFHVSLLKPFTEDTKFAVPDLPLVFARGRPVSRPSKLLERRTVLRDGEPIEECLLEWADDAGESPTWEPIAMVQRRFPSLLLEDKEILNLGGVDTDVLASHGAEDTIAKEGDEETQEARPEVSYDTVERAEQTTVASGRKERPKRQSRRPEKFGDYVPR